MKQSFPKALWLSWRARKRIQQRKTARPYPSPLQQAFWDLMAIRTGPEHD